jgi:DNA-3-methyladenine glycosylase
MAPDRAHAFHPLPRTFYQRPTLEIAPDLLGRYLVVAGGQALVGGRIVEVEAYIGEDDPACHAHRGRTRRNAVMYGPPGRAYVYFTYGNHWMLNVVTEQEGFPAALLIRALEPTIGLDAIRNRRQVSAERNLTNGPGKLTSALGISGSDNGLDLHDSRLLISREFDRPLAVGRSGRVGVSEGSDLPWRFFDSASPCVSLYRSGTRVSRRTQGRTKSLAVSGDSLKGKRR